MAADSQANLKKSWFEANPKTTIVLVLMIFLVAATIITEKVLAYINHNQKMVLFTERRYINLREYQPNLDVTDTPPAKAVREGDGLVQKPYRVRTDANGFILPYHHYAKPDFKIFFLGASTTACIYADEESRFPYLVGNLLEQQTGKKVTSINSGAGGNNSLHSLDILLNKLIPQKPDAVVLMHNINDLVALIYDKTYWSRNPTRQPIIDYKLYKDLTGIKAVSTLARDTYIPNLHLAIRSLSHKIFRKKTRDPEDEYAYIRGKKIAFNGAQILNEFRMNLQTFIYICKARHITPVLMTQFNRYKKDPDPKIKAAMAGFEKDSGISEPQFKEIYDQFNEAVRQVGHQNGVLVIDLARLIPQESQYMYDVVHLNTTGSKLAARLISEQLRPVVK
ncbi:MAG: SGNH/GDSL hydrolase family protein [Deltaproteobacteria bacterium]|nr:SGNH/GDSL hydrolase family protein [Deltaproteobacteria bacterium]